MRKCKWILAVVLAVVCSMLAFTACSDDEQQSGGQTTAPVITASVDAPEITAGEQITLTWSATEGAQVSVSYTLDGIAEDELTFTSGTPFTISEAGVYVFTFTAEGAENKTVTVTVTETQTGPEPEPETPVITASSDKAQIEAGEQITLTWSATEGAQVSVSYTLDGIAEDELTFTSGTPFTISEAGVYVFTFTAEGAENKTVTVTVTETQTEPEPEEYSVTFILGEYAAEGEEVPATKTAEKGTNITLPAAPSAAFGYQFTGWSDGEQTYAAQAEYVVDGDVTLMAQWAFVGGEYANAVLDTWGQALVHSYALRDGESLVLTAKLSGAMSATAWEEGVFVQVNDGTKQYFFRPANTWWTVGGATDAVKTDFVELTALIDHDTFNALKADTRIVVTRSENKIFVTYDFGIVVVGFTIENVTEASAEVYFILYDLAAEPNSGDTEWIEAREVKVEWLPSVEKPTPDPAIIASASAAEVTTTQQITLTWRATHKAEVTVTYTKDGETADGLTFMSGTPFTISEAGVYVFTFTAEGAENKTVTITVKEPHVHSYGAWQVTAPTQTEGGSAVRTCMAEDCDRAEGATQTVVLPALDTENAYTLEVKMPATCEGTGITTYTYTADTTISFDVTVPATGHKYSAVSVAYDAEEMSKPWTAEVICENNAEHKLTLSMAAFDAAEWMLDTENGYTAPSHTSDGSGNYYTTVAQDGYSVKVTVTGVTIPTNAEHTYAATYTAEGYEAGETQIGCTYEGCENEITVTLPQLPAAGAEEDGWSWTLVMAPENGVDGSGTFTCTVTVGDETADITVTDVVVKAPVITANASAEEIAPGEEVTLTWSATEGAEIAVSYTKDGEDADGLKPVSGEAFVIAEEGVYVFTFTAEGAKDVTVTITVAKPNLVMDEEWSLPDAWQQNADGLINSNNNGNIANVNWLSNYAVLANGASAGDYSVTVTFRGTRTNHDGTAGNNIEIGVIPWYLDAQNYVIVYLQFWANWGYSNMGLTSIEVLYFRDGIQYGLEGVTGFNSHFMDNPSYSGTNCASLNPDDEITIRVDKVLDGNMDVYTVTVSGQNTEGQTVSVTFIQAYSISVEYHTESAGIGLYSWNDTVTFSRLTVEPLNEDTQISVENTSAIFSEGGKEEFVHEEPTVQ